MQDTNRCAQTEYDGPRGGFLVVAHKEHRCDAFGLCAMVFHRCKQRALKDFCISASDDHRSCHRPRTKDSKCSSRYGRERKSRQRIGPNSSSRSAK